MDNRLDRIENSGNIIHIEYDTSMVINCRQMKFPKDKEKISGQPSTRNTLQDWRILKVAIADYL